MFISKYRNMILGIILVCSFSFFCQTAENATPNDSGWQNLSTILKQIQPPKFPEQEFVLTDYNAVGDGKTDCSEAFKNAIDDCHQSGGGSIIVPEGKYLTGAITLKSNVNLRISENAEILFSTDTQKYLPVVFSRWEGVECMNYSPFIYAYEQENIAITGKGSLNGQADVDHWWNWKGRTEYGWHAGQPSQDNGRKQLFEMAENSVPPEKRIMGEGYYLRPQFIQLYRCKNILIAGITITNSPMWEIHPVLSENVTVRDVTVRSKGPNNDGCNPESCKNVLIDHCFFDTGDDCIAIKSGRNADGRRINVSSENIVVRNCQMKDGHGGVVIGSEISGGARNIYVDSCQMDSPNLDRALRIKTNSKRGGLIENIFFRNVTIGEVNESILRVNFYYEEGDAGDFTPVVRSIYMDNVISKKSKQVFYLQGYPHSKIREIIISNSSFKGVARASEINNVGNLVLENVEISSQ